MNIVKSLIINKFYTHSKNFPKIDSQKLGYIRPDGTVNFASPKNTVKSLIINKFYIHSKDFKKIDSQKLGYVCPDGTINFASPNVALEYAKNRVVAPLRQAKPFERLILIDKSRVIKEVDGGKDGVDFDTTKYNFDTLVHGHCDVLGKGKTLPISTEDVVLFINNAPNGAKKSIVYNSKGEYSMLERKPPMKKEDVPEFIRDFYFNGYHRRCLGAAIEYRDNLQTLVTNKFLELNISGKLKEFVKSLPEDNFFEALDIKLNSIVQHKALKDNCDKFGSIYSTNFSNLVD